MYARETLGRGGGAANAPAVGNRPMWTALAASLAAAYPRDRAAAILPLGIAILALFDVTISFIDFPAHLRLSAEDGLVENLSFAADLVAGIYVLCTLRTRRCQAFQVLLGLGLVWLAGEEISWGQRLFALATPDYLAAINLQHELTVHNIDGIQQHIKPIGATLLLSYAFGLPILYSVSRAARIAIDRVGLPLFRLDGLAVLGVAILVMALPRLMGFGNPYDETGELALGTALLLFALGSGGRHAHPR